MEPFEATHAESPKLGGGGVKWGILLIIVAMIFGVPWTLLMFLGEAERGPAYGTMLTAAATLAVIIAGVLLMLSRSAKNIATVAFWLAAAAVATYVFGFAVCWTNAW